MPSGSRTSVGQRVCNALLLSHQHLPFPLPPKSPPSPPAENVCVRKVYYFHLIFARLFFFFLFCLLQVAEPFGSGHSIYVPLGRSCPKWQIITARQKNKIGMGNSEGNLSRKTRAKKRNVESCLYNQNVVQIDLAGAGVRMTRQVDRSVLPRWYMERACGKWGVWRGKRKTIGLPAKKGQSQRQRNVSPAEQWQIIHNWAQNFDLAAVNTLGIPLISPKSPFLLELPSFLDCAGGHISLAPLAHPVGHTSVCINFTHGQRGLET